MAGRGGVTVTDELALAAEPQHLTGSQRVPVRVYRCLFTGGHTLDFIAISDSSGGDHGMRDQALTRARKVLGKEASIEGITEVRTLGWLDLADAVELLGDA